MLHFQLKNQDSKGNMLGFYHSDYELYCFCEGILEVSNRDQQQVNPAAIK